MAAQALPFAKFARGSFGFPSKNKNVAKKAENDEDWYIPYNGPYEAPREHPSRRKLRDSWGDPLEPDDDEDDTVLNDRELYLRYGGHNNRGRHVEEERTGRRRDRTFSVASGHSVSTVDPSRRIAGTNRRSTVSAGARQAVPSYISLDAVGGVGESPIPPPRSAKDGSRTGLSGIFSFGAQPRRPPASTAASVERVVSGSSGHKTSRLKKSNVRAGYDKDRVNSKAGSQARYRSSPERHANTPMKDKHRQLDRQVMSQADRLSSDATEEDYYNTYYSTLVREQRSEPALNQRDRHHRSPSLSEDLHQSLIGQSSLNRQNSSSSSSGHPYALARPRYNVEEASTTPLIPQSKPPQLTFAAPSHIASRGVDSPRTLKLKNSVSTPDLRNSALLHEAIVTAVIPKSDLMSQQIATPHFAFPKPRDRWLSAETWCHAVLFPRPRLKVGTNGWIVSPPDSPLGPNFIGPAGIREPGVASRVLAHSHSLVDLNRPAGSSSYPNASTSVPHGRQAQASGHPTTFALDDLALPTPVPSLAHVLEQGQQLANERKAWELQATTSFGNKHIRSLSKTRSKSLTRGGRRRGPPTQTSMEYLAAQACLGNQNVTPTLPMAEFGMVFPNTTYASSTRKGSHSHDNSLAKSLSKSSKSGCHSRGDSWSKSAVKVAKSTVAICGFSSSEDEVAALTERDVRATSLEDALKRDGTRVIRLADPVYIPVDRGVPVNPDLNNSTRMTPSPSDTSDQRVGIALGTPPLEDDRGDSSYHPFHPYAQGGLSFSVPGPSSNQTRIDRGAEFAGPHPSINSAVDIPPISHTLAKHKLPPHVLLHPYAQGPTRDSYIDQNGLIGQYRSGAETPDQMKMWAQLSPGVLREVLPGDFQYSPFTPRDNTSPISTSSSDLIHINDTIGVGDMLANASRFRRSQDSGFGPNDSDNHDVMAAKPTSQVDCDIQPQNTLPEFGPRTIQKPIQHNSQPSGGSEAMKKPFFTNQVVSASPEQQPPTPDRSDSAITSTSSSPPFMPRHLGSPNDLESFQDLFYRPNNNLRATLNEPAFLDTPSHPDISTSGWDRSMQNPKTESGLTSLARQLSEEFELMALERGRSSSQYSSILSSAGQQSGSASRRPTDGSLHFVFEEATQSELPPELDLPTIHAFHPSGTLPEDVESSRASSIIERIETGEEDDTAMVRLRVVESLLTPASVAPEHRPNSYAGETTLITDNNNDQLRHQNQPESSPTLGVSGEARARVFSGLQPPSSDATRTSFMTTSTASRMSGLSDFPVPPKDDRHVSLGTFFNESFAQSELQSEIPLLPPDRQVVFGGNQNAGDLAKTLSSSSLSSN